MIEAIKDKLWGVLRDKDVSLAMVYDRHGRILWHRGRSVRGCTVAEGDGFPKSQIESTLCDGHEVVSEDVVVMSSGDGLPQSARALYLKSVLILPIERDFFLYLDSGSKESFDRADREVFRALGELLGESLAGLRNGSGKAGGMAGSSVMAQQVRDLVVSYAMEEEPVLLTGETGVGKSFLAELLHRASGRRGRLVVVHCPSIPESLFEREIFGHRRGAFTGATENRSGLVMEADGGTLFLDEVSEMPTPVQAKLLSFVETRRYRMVGDPREHEADVRLLAASNRDLAEAVREGLFRSDLYYRLNVLPINIPPLRDRAEDIRDLVANQIELLRGKRPTPAFFEVLCRHSWPGNVRELIQVMKRCGIRLPGPEIGAEVENLLTEGLMTREAEDQDVIAEVLLLIEEGATFWDSAWRRFLDRDVNREQMQRLLKHRFIAAGASLRRLAVSLNIAEDEYPRFVSALHKYDIHPGRD